MKYDPNIHHRKSYRLKGYDYSSPGAYFVTICTKERETFFGEIINSEMILNETGKIAFNNWLEIPSFFDNVEIDEFVVMPNHIHGIIIICEYPSRDVINYVPANYVPANYVPANYVPANYVPAGLNNDSLLGKIIRHYKARTTKMIRNQGFDFSWQSRYHDWIIRNEKHLDNVRLYILKNPLKWHMDKNHPVNI